MAEHLNSIRLLIAEDFYDCSVVVNRTIINVFANRRPNRRRTNPDKNTKNCDL